MIDEKLMEEALHTITRLNDRLAHLEAEKRGDHRVAVVGMACRFPGAPDLPHFWRNLCAGEDNVGTYPVERLALLGLTEADLGGDVTSIHGGYLDDIDQFDPSFFGISPREARCMDPQQRLLMMTSHQALVDADILDKDDLTQTGVFVSHYSSQYTHFSGEYDKESALFLATGNALSITANRLSYHYNFNGPSMMLDTACSSSLVGLDIAHRYLAAGEINYAVVAGISLNLNPKLTQLLQDAAMLAPDGRCKTFDAAADGYVPGEGVGVVVLRRLEDCLKEKTPVWAVLGGCAVAQDGKSNGLTAPNGWAQEAVLRDACKKAGVQPRAVQFVETHGTGTYLGDPVEMEALHNVLAPDREEPCVLGCLKTNIGHLEPAAGIAGFIKACLCIHEERIPPNNNLSQINPLLRFDADRFTLPQRNLPWHAEERIAGVSSFGFGGVNGHVILRNGPEALVHKRRLKAYPLHFFDTDSYWLKPAPRQITAPNARFLDYRAEESPTEFLRVFMTIDRALPGIDDTGNFHIGFYIETIYKIFHDHFGLTQLTLKRIEFQRMLFVAKQAPTQIQFLIRQEDDRRFQLACYFKFQTPGSKWVQSASAEVDLDQTTTSALVAEPLTPLLKEVDREAFYRIYEGMGYPGMGYVRVIAGSRVYENESRADLQLEFDTAKYQLGVHPGFLDAVLQPGFVMQSDETAGVLHMTTLMEDVQIHEPLSSEHGYHLRNRLGATTPDGFQMDWTLYDDQGRVKIHCGKAVLKSLTRDGVALAHMAEFRAEREGVLSTRRLLEEIGRLLEADPTTIDTRRELLELGMDSLMVMKLQAILDQWELPVNNLFDMTVDDLIQLVAGVTPRAEGSRFSAIRDLQPYRLDRDLWLRGRRQSKVRLRLYCFPYGHSSTTIFRNWIDGFPEDIEVRPIELPGRGARLKEQPIESAMEIAALLTRMLGDELNEPFAIYGHSAGALLAYAWCVYLQQGGQYQPECLFASAFTAPCIPNPVVGNLAQSYRRHGVPEIPTLAQIMNPEQPDFVDRVIDVLEESMHEEGLFSLSRELIHAQLHAIVSAFQMVASFDSALVTPLNIPIAALHGEAEGQVTLEEMQAWERLTTQAFSLRVFSGDHLFMDPDQNETEVITHLINTLNQLTTAVSGSGRS